MQVLSGSEELSLSEEASDSDSDSFLPLHCPACSVSLFHQSSWLSRWPCHRDFLSDFQEFQPQDLQPHDC